jgi:ribulose-5-phosphate 4-epimerase/fuculose-1-phosphate aldolase
MNFEISLVGKAPAQQTPVRERVTASEWQARVELAAAYRLIAHFRLTDTIYNHISLRVPDQENVFLINSFGLLYEEVTASNLVKINIDGDIIDDPTHMGVNRPGFIIHGASHRARPDVAAVLHTHTTAGIAVSIQQEGLLPISQHAAELIGRIAYHEFEGIAVNLEEQKRLVNDFGSHYAMVLNNHGLLTAGRNIGECFQIMLRLEAACAIQIAALSGGSPLRRISDKSVHSTQATIDQIGGDYSRDWSALLRLAFRLDPRFAD